VVSSFIALVYYALQPRYLFLVKIEDGDLRVTRGKVSANFLAEMDEAVTRNGVRHGWVGGVRRGQKICLAFSRSIPPGCQQQIRNLWAMQR
jgi:hypothetical protein